MPLPGSDYKSVIRFVENDVTVPSRFGTHILVTVNINGAPVELVLDTGASYSLVTSKLAKELKLKVVRGLYVGCNSFSHDFVESNIRIGKIVVRNQRLCPILYDGLDAEVAGRKLKVSGLLGYDFLRNFVVEVNYARGILRLHNPKSYRYPPDKNYVGEVPFRLVNGTPHIDVTAVFTNKSRRKVDALLDTGSWIPLLVKESLYDEVRPARSWEFGHGWILDIQEFFSYEPNNLAGPINYDVIIGNSALTRYALIFDYLHNQLIVSDSLVR